MKQLLLMGAALLCLFGCTRYEPAPEMLKAPEPLVGADWNRKSVSGFADVMERVVTEVTAPRPVKVKGIYISGYAAGNAGMMEEFVRRLDETELNAMVIDFKNDEGRITCPVETGVMGEIGAGTEFISDIEGVLASLKEHEIYTIARVVAFRDPYLAQHKPEWCLKTKDGQIYRDKKGQSWVNPYCREVWEYLAEVALEAYRVGFDEVQFDYIRFDTDSSMKQVHFDEADTKGMSKTEVVTEFIRFMKERFRRTGLMISADVFGAIIGSPVDAEAVGQSYGDMSASLDYICPMIYPSHYGDGNFGLDHPDMHPYEAVLGALGKSREELSLFSEEPQAIVRPWLQDFTASYLKHHITYGPEELRQQIDAVYDAGYEEWILWNAACRYSWDGLLKEEEDGENAEGGGILPPL